MTELHSLLDAFGRLRPEETAAEPAVSELNDKLKNVLPSPYTNEVLCLKRRAVLDAIEASAAGEPFKRMFITFVMNITAGLPKLEEILADPNAAPLPTDLHFQYVVASAIARRVAIDNADTYATYLKRLQPDIASMAAHDAIARDKALASSTELRALAI